MVAGGGYGNSVRLKLASVLMEEGGQVSALCVQSILSLLPRLQ